MDKKESLGSVSKTLMLAEPFYGLFLITLNKVWKDIGTLGVSKNGINYQLTIDEGFWNSLPDLHKLGVMKHECLHIAFFHLLTRDKYPDHKLHNIAADCEINQYIDRDWLPGGAWNSTEEHEAEVKPLYEELQRKLEAEEITPIEYKTEAQKIPSRGVFLEDFKELNLDPKAGTDYYYKKMLKDWDPQKQESKSGCKTLENLMKDQDGDGEMHVTWGDFDEMSESEKKLIQQQAEYQLKEVADQVKRSSPGSIPGELAEMLAGLEHTEPPKFNWKKYLRNFVGGTEMSDFISTRKRLNKRFIGSPGKRVTPKKHVLVGIDTSGSVSNEELQEFFHEIRHMHKTGANVTIVHCDTTIQKIERYNPKSELKVYGRGGTDFNPVINYFNDHHHTYTCLIYVTDGECSVPDNKAKGKMLWVLSSRSSEEGYWTESLKEYAPLIKLN